MPNTNPFQALTSNMFTKSFTTRTNDNSRKIQVSHDHTETVSEIQNILELLHRATAKLKFEGFLEALWVDLCVCGLTTLQRRLLLLEKELLLTKATE